MAVAKGQWDNERGYLYTCGNCHDAPIISVTGDSLDWPYCYGGDWDKLVKAFETARGERYYALPKAMLRIRGKQYVDAFWSRKERDGKISPGVLVELFLDSGFPVNRWKPFVEWLSERGCLPTFAYEHLKESGFKLGEAIKIVQARLAECR